MTKTVLAIDKMVARQVDFLDDHFDVIRLWAQRNPEAIIQENAHQISAITSSLLPVRRNMIEALPNLEIIANCAVGYDHIDLSVCAERGIIVTNTPDVLTDDTADVAMLLMLNVMRRAVEGDAYTRAGLWSSQGPLQLGASLQKKTLGIVGLGRIGQAIAERAEAFKMKIAYQGPNEKDVPYQYFQKLGDLAEASDVLCIACPANKKTEGLINQPIFKKLGSDGFLINISRGSVVVEDHLIIALHNRDIAGAGLDVYENEPNVPKELIKMDNVVLTPHIGSATVETRNKMGQIVLGNLISHFEGKPLLSKVDIL